MKIVNNYTDKISDLISGNTEYQIPVGLTLSNYTPGTFERPEIVLNVLSTGGTFQSSFTLENNTDFYVKNDQIYLKPNEVLDREGFFAGDYNLRYDFIQPINSDENNKLYLGEVSPSRREIRLSTEIDVEINLNKINNFFITEGDDYNFDCQIELSNGRSIPINAFAIDNQTGNRNSIILKLNQEFPTDVAILDRNFRLVKTWFASQEQTITFVDEENLATGGGRFLDVDTSYLTENTSVEDDITTYSEIITGSEDVVSSFVQRKKDVNLNIDFSEFSNHVFFGSAVSKLENFKDKVVKLEGLYTQLSASLSISSSMDEIENRKNLFGQIRKEKENFTSYEKFMYEDNQRRSPNSAPGLQTNLAGGNYKNKYENTYTTLSGSNAEGFDKLYNKTSVGTDRIHLFTDVYNVEQPPFFNTNDFVYLSFILRSTGSVDQLHISGGLANLEINNIGYKGYGYGRNYQIPFNAFSGSALSNPVPTGSHYQRYIFKSQQNYFRPEEVNPDVFTISDYTSTSTAWEILSGSNVQSASTSGSIGDGFAYGIRDSSGQQTQYIFPSVVDKNNLTNTFSFITGSLLPQGDLFPVFINTGIHNAKFTDVRVTYKDPTNVHPFSNVYRPPSGSYAGSDEWNNWYSGVYASASLYDTNNIHSLVNNLPLELRSGDQHDVLRRFVNMLAEQYDLLRNYIDNYLNFYKLGYTNPNSMPDNLMPILGDTIGWELLNVQNKNTSIEDYAESTAGDEVGVQAVINSTWKKILNNLVYVYKTKGTTEAIQSLLNLYGFDSNGFKLHEYGGSTAEHNPTIITNEATNFENGLKNVQGNVSFVQEIQPFPMINFRGTNSLGVDWWRNDATANGIEFVFNADKSLSDQTILRSSGSNNDLWDLRLIPSASSTAFSQLQFRLNTSNSGSGAIASNAVSMSSPFVDFQNGNIYNVMLQRTTVTGSSPHNAFTQSYELFVARKDDDKILDVSSTTLSTHISGANYNFVNQDVSKTSENLFVGETLSGSLAELRVWNTKLNISKFKQHTLNYRSTVSNTITGSVDDIIFRYPFDENIVNWSTNPNSASLKVHDANSQNVKDYSIFIISQSNFNYTTTMTEQTFYRFAIKGNDKLPNDNQTNLTPRMKTTGELSADQASIEDPTDASGQPERQFTNRFGRDVSYVNAIDGLVMNLMPDFRIDDFIGDPDEDLTDTYEDLATLRRKLLEEPGVRIDVEANIRAVENLLTDELKETLEILTPAKTNFEMFYDVKNDSLYRAKIPKRAQLTTKLNPNKAIGVIDADKFDEPTIVSTANENIKTAFIDADKFDEPTVISFANNNLRVGNIDADQWDEPTINSFANHKVVEGNIDADQWDEPTLISTYENIQGGTNIEMVDTSNSRLANNFSATAEKMNEFFLGGKNNIAKNAGTASNQRFFKSRNPGVLGDYNTYKFESRFTFKTIGDTEKFQNSQSHHDVFSSFRNRHFVDQNHPQNYVYNSFFGSDGNATVDGRMVGRTRFFKTDADGNITYPSNHYINARTSKDRLLKLTYLGTQHDGTNPTQDPIKNDPQPTVPAYIIGVRGSDTINRLKVERPLARETISFGLDLRVRNRLASAQTKVTVEIFRKGKLLASKELHSIEGTDGLSRLGDIKFGLSGDIKDYRMRITPTGRKRIARLVVVGKSQPFKNPAFANKPPQRPASFSMPQRKKNADGVLVSEFKIIRILGPFKLNIEVEGTG